MTYEGSGEAVGEMWDSDMQALAAPVFVLRSLCTRGATGEFVCVAEGIEWHVHLDRGRLAWATSSDVRGAFRRSLCIQCGLSPEELECMLEECRSQGMTLTRAVEMWGKGGASEVRAATADQVGAALRSLCRRPVGSTLFLDRQGAYRDHDPEMTFDAIEMLDSFEAELETPRSTMPGATLARLMASIPGARWVQLASADEPAHVVSRVPATPALPAIPEISELDLMVLRAPGGTVVCVPFAVDERHLWIRLRREAPLGPVLAALRSHLPQRVFRWGSMHEPGVDHLAVVEPTGVLRAPSVRPPSGDEPIAQLLRQVPALSAAAVLDEHGRITHSASQRASDVQSLFAPVQRYGKLLPSSEAPGGLAAFDFECEGEGDWRRPMSSLAVSMDGQWFFMIEHMAGPTPRQLWLSLRFDCPPGLGWACLSHARATLAGLVSARPRRLSAVG